MTILGIDLGTTNSLCAVWKDGNVKMIPNRLGKFLTPSVVGIDENGEILIGETAKQRLISHSSKTVSLFKRYMGTDFSISPGGKHFNAVELSSIILKSLKEDAEVFLDEKIEEAIISVPAYFNDAQRKATKLAGELIGLKVERLINEPTAGALAYGLNSLPDESTFIILDLGGGTFDVSIIEYFDGVFEVHASTGDNSLGGEDFLDVLVNKFILDNNIEEKKLSNSDLQKLCRKMENIKVSLNSDNPVTVEEMIPDQKKSWTIQRKEFEKISKVLLNRIQMPTERAIRDSNLSLSELKDIILIGGASKMQIFRSLIVKMFKRMPRFNIDPDLVVAMGAAIVAGMKERDETLEDIVLTDVSPHSLGIEVHNPNSSEGFFAPIIERNSVVPLSIVETFNTVRDNQNIIEVKIFQGESRLVNNNIFLGKLKVPVPAKPAGDEKIDVRFSYDMNGILEVDITVQSTEFKRSKIINNSSGNMNEKEIEASIKKMQALKFHPRELEVNRVVLAKADRIFSSILGENRAYVGELISNFRALLEKQIPSEIEKGRKSIEKELDNFDSRVF